MVFRYLVIFSILFGSVFSATCAYDSFLKSCNSCSFENGKMDESCWKEYESQGTTCLATSYPMMSFKYTMGGCSEMDICVSKLAECKERFTTGSDEVDCMNRPLIECFVVADKCAEAANKICAEGKDKNESGFTNATNDFGEIEDLPPTNKTDVYEELSGNDMMNFICLGIYPIAGLLILAFVKMK